MTMPTSSQSALSRRRRAVTTLRGVVAALFVIGAGVLVAGVVIEHATVRESAHETSHEIAAAAPSSKPATTPRGPSDADGGVEGAPSAGGVAAPSPPTSAPSPANDADRGIEGAPVGGAPVKGAPGDGNNSGHAVSDGTRSTESGESPSSETVLGLHAESLPLVVLAVALSLGAGLMVLRTPRRSALILAGGFATGFVVFDGAELAHQAAESRPALIALAGVTTAVHALAALGLVALIVQGGQDVAAAPAQRRLTTRNRP